MARTVFIKKLTVDMDIKTAGIEFAVSNSEGSHQGDLYVTKTGLIWCLGKTARANGKKITWDNFAADMAKR
jgi:hypothetical protein